MSSPLTDHPLSRPASFPSPTAARPPAPLPVDTYEHNPLTPTSSLPASLSRNRSISPPARPAALFPRTSPLSSPPPAHASSSSPLSRPPFLPAPSSPSLNIANDPPPAGGPVAPRNIVILLDGTGNMFSRRNSNVIKTLSVLEADETQLVYYSSGVGTILPDHASTWGSVRTAVARGIDTALAWNFQEFVCDAYKYLMDFYRAGDKLYIFGFSRGAYTARALAGMIQKVGLLAPGNYNQVPLAYEVYTRPNAVAYREGMSGGEELSVIYRQIFGISRTVRIEFLGVWDTVSSLGGITLPRLPYASNVKSVKFFRHALALDERRARFAPEYRRFHADESCVDPSACLVTLRNAWSAHSILHSPNASVSDKVDAKKQLDEMLDQKYPEIARTRVVMDDGTTSVRYLRKNVEAWFMGAHSDVGGGNDLNGESSLSNIPFRWMLREAVQCGLKLEAVGICLQPAIYLHPAVVEAGHIPAELIQILREELRGETVEFETEKKVRSLVDQHLPHSRLVEILELAAGYDAGVSPQEILSDAERRKEAESGGTQAQEGQAAHEQDHVDIMDPRGLPIGPDGVMLGTESLRGPWWLLEGAILQTRKFEGSNDGGKDVWRANLGRPRQMAVGQYIHRSVQKRLRFEHPLDEEQEEKTVVKWWRRMTIKVKQRIKGDTVPVPVEEGKQGGTGYEGPKALLPTEWGMTWDDLRRGRGGVVWEE